MRRIIERNFPNLIYEGIDLLSIPSSTSKTMKASFTADNNVRSKTLQKTWFTDLDS